MRYQARAVQTKRLKEKRGRKKNKKKTPQNCNLLVHAHKLWKKTINECMGVFKDKNSLDSELVITGTNF